MTKEEWRQFIPYFTPEECGEKMDYGFMLLLLSFRIILDSPIHIICGWDDRKGYHGKGRAADWWSTVPPRKTLRLLDRTGFFNGVGFYPWGAHLSFHTDNRPPEKYQRWLSPRKGKYIYLLQ